MERGRARDDGAAKHTVDKGGRSYGCIAARWRSLATKVWLLWLRQERIGVRSNHKVGEAHAYGAGSACSVGKNNGTEMKQIDSQIAEHTSDQGWVCSLKLVLTLMCHKRTQEMVHPHTISTPRAISASQWWYLSHYAPHPLPQLLQPVLRVQQVKGSYFTGQLSLPCSSRGTCLPCAGWRWWWGPAACVEGEHAGRGWACVRGGVEGEGGLGRACGQVLSARPCWPLSALSSTQY